jgi:orotate phosphoribosyltransferase
MSSIQEDYYALREMLKAKSLKHGSILLSSGLKSNTYVDARLTTFTAQGMTLIGRLCVAHLKEVGWTPSTVGGMARGATPISMAIGYESSLQGSSINVLIFQKNLEHPNGIVEGLATLTGVDTVIVEDTVSTGTSVADSIIIAKQVGINVLGALCLVDRQMGAKEKLFAERACVLHSIFLLSDLTS